MRQTRFLPFIFAAIVIPAQAAEEEITSTLKDQSQVAVTIYNQDLALVKDTRHISLTSGDHRLAWRDVSAKIRPETALLRNLTHPKGFYLIEQNFDFDLLTPDKLLEKYVGHKVKVIKTNPATGAETIEEASVLSVSKGVVLQFPDRIESHPPGRIAFQAIPDNLRDRPTLVISLHTPNTNSQEMELSYLTGGLGWKADYVAEITPRDDKLDLSGWVTLTNQSGAAYHNAKLQLVAGNVNQVKNIITYGIMDARFDGYSSVKEQKMAEEKLFEYHLYSLDHPTTLADNQTKQVALLSASNIAVRKELVLRGADNYYRSNVGDIGKKLKTSVYVEFDNKGQGLGIPLPMGIVRVYKKDSAGNTQFVGEDRIDHTPKNEKVRLRLGEAFDVTADKKQTDFKRLSGDSNYEASFQTVLKNAKNETETVRVEEPIPGEWEILSESHPHTKESSHMAVWNITIPAEGEVTLKYRVHVEH